VRPWYEAYFSADYWVYAADEYTPSRTAAEVSYLAAVLGSLAPGRRVLDVGCGLGRHANALARLGFDVVGVDVSPWAVDRARAAGTTARFVALDALTTPATRWPVEPGGVDAVVCVQAFGWGRDAQQAALLGTLRRLLVPGGVLVLDHSNVSAILRVYSPHTSVTVRGHEFSFDRTYDPLTGRSGGTLTVRRPDGSTTTAVDDVRLYQPPEVAALIGGAGFEVLRVDAEFVAGGPVGIDTRYAQFVARAPARPVSALAGHRAAVAPGAVDLRWAPDEVDLVLPAVTSAWTTAVGAAGAGPPDGLRRYDVADPYGAGRCAEVLGEHFGVSLPASRVTAGAGATGLLRALAILGTGATVLVEPAGHPESASAAVEVGAVVRTGALTADAVRDAAPAVVVLDRPGVTGEVWPPWRVRELAGAVAAAGGVLVVDETCAAYLPVDESVVALTGECERIVVVRSMSKGYCCGGLRVGFAIASADLAARVRDVCPPLATAGLSLDVALALLRQGDVLAGLRERVAQVRPRFVELLATHGLHAIAGDPRLPWVTVRRSPAADAALAELGIAAKEVPVAPGTPPLLRLSVPLSQPRRRAAWAALGDGHARAGRP
jgi:histidinol-phosphate/aromatic aminotransferase/cobyric acid decarboxylase-like protein/SAM-dependent methyltransferase